ncbi:hypothetical protein [Sutcliffiella sp. FSL R7-0096]|uniref:hypothetical protein n=1 Tax=Sutcliffiella sp. FSL R7-0096 TaxID=2921670 RepID=UPI00315A748F
MHQYYDFQFVLTFDLEEIKNMLIEAFRVEQEKKAWDLYQINYSRMDKDNFVPFDKFYNPGGTESDKTEDEILTEVRDMLVNFNFVRKEGDK